jgi:hypothetical protein
MASASGPSALNLFAELEPLFTEYGVRCKDLTLETKVVKDLKPYWKVLIEDPEGINRDLLYLICDTPENLGLFEELWQILPAYNLPRYIHPKPHERKFILLSRWCSMFWRLTDWTDITSFLIRAFGRKGTPEEAVTDCGICLEPLTSHVAEEISCHKLHKHCLNRLLENNTKKAPGSVAKVGGYTCVPLAWIFKCPTCRKQYDPLLLTPINGIIRVANDYGILFHDTEYTMGPLAKFCFSFFWDDTFNPDCLLLTVTAYVDMMETKGFVTFNLYEKFGKIVVLPELEEKRTGALGEFDDAVNEIAEIAEDGGFTLLDHTKLYSDFLRHSNYGTCRDLRRMCKLSLSQEKSYFLKPGSSSPNLTDMIQKFLRLTKGQ